MSNEQQPGETGTAAPLSPQGAARRRFTRAGAAASGVLLTLHSQPGMAQAVCTTPSGFLSGALRSVQPTTPVTCVGRTPGYWKEHTPWTGLSVQTNTKFSTLFACSSSMKTTYGAASTTCLSILDPKTWDKNGVGRHLVAAYLNVISGKSSFQNVAMLQAIWNEYRSKGYYTPTAGVKWTGTQIVDYLTKTMPL